MNLHPNNPPPAPFLYTIPLPSQIDPRQPPVIHLVLRYPEPRGTRYLDLDLNTPPSQLWNLLQSRTTLLSKYMDQPATEPGVPSMTIVHPDLQWPITVHASGQYSQWVTVADVVQTICRIIQLPLTEQDLSAMRGSQSWLGSSRLDLLNGKTRLVGLEKVAYGGEIWEMVII